MLAPLVDVVQDCFKTVDLQDVFKLGKDQDHNDLVGRSIELDLKLQVSALFGFNLSEPASPLAT